MINYDHLSLYMIVLRGMVLVSVTFHDAVLQGSLDRGFDNHPTLKQIE